MKETQLGQKGGLEASDGRINGLRSVVGVKPSAVGSAIDIDQDTAVRSLQTEVN